MPCFNSADFVAESIESILSQTFTDFELILIDDGSTDATLGILKQYAAKDNRIVVIEKEHTGSADSRNWGIRASQGGWIAILDSDDIALPTRLEQQLAYVSKKPELVMLGSDFIPMGSSVYIIKKHHYPSKHYDLVKRLQRSMSFPPHSSFIYRTEIVKRIGGFNPRYVPSEDTDLYLRLAEQGRIAYMNKPLVKIRKHSNNISIGREETQVLHALAAVVCHFLRNKNTPDPSACGKDEDWRAFVEWIALRAEQQELFERRRTRSQLTLRYFSSGYRLIGAWRLMTGLASSRHTFQILHEKYFGSDLATTLADEWIRKL